MPQDHYEPAHFINRELSWLEFNRRVLEEAEDATQPLMERVKFLNITSTNLDEFFEIRVAGIKQQIENRSLETGPDGLAPPEIFDQIQRRAHGMVERQFQVWNGDLVPALAANGVRFHEAAALKGAWKVWARRYFVEEVFPVLTPLAVDASHPFPQVINKSHNIIAALRRPGKGGGAIHAIIQLPRVLPRLIRLPGGNPQNWDFLHLKALVRHYVAELFPGLRVLEAHAFRVTRNSDLYIDDEEAENLLRTIEMELRKRNRGNAVRLEVQADCPEPIEVFLRENLNLVPEDVYRVDGPLNFAHLSVLWTDGAFARFRDRPFKPSWDPGLPPDADPFAMIRKRDVLLHHPYESFDSVVGLVESAARDPHVLAVKMTLYRTSGDSPIVRALMEAASEGKQVTVIVELKARFDEANNIQWARQLEEAGCHVVYGVVGLKTHCKLLLLVRRDEDRIRFYCHLGTGNYHPSTARLYTDLGLLTCSPEITQEVATLFNTLTGVAEYPGFKRMLVAPFDLAERFEAMIRREAELARAGRPGHIIVKVNSLVDPDMIAALYDASRAGVKIDLIVRGICCLRPGLPGVSENIRVISIVGRFLEHSRIFYFANDGRPEVYLGSADWMPRNFYRRVEVAFPVDAPAVRAHIAEEILPVYLTDCVKARELRPDGTYVRLRPKPGGKPAQAQLTFRELARRQAAALAAAPRQRERRLRPVEAPPARG